MSEFKEKKITITNVSVLKRGDGINGKWVKYACSTSEGMKYATFRDFTPFIGKEVNYLLVNNGFGWQISKTVENEVPVVEDDPLTLKELNERVGELEKWVLEQKKIQELSEKNWNKSRDGIGKIDPNAAAQIASEDIDGDILV